jgi:hypothetical protein
MPFRARLSPPLRSTVATNAGERLALPVPRPATLEEYVNGLRAIGTRVCEGSGRTYWVSSAERVVRRLPTFHIGTPSSDEIDRAMRMTGAVLATYVTEPDERRAANAWLYLCDDENYGSRRLAPAMQRNVRRAMRELTIDWVSPRELLAQGGSAFCDTRRRCRLDDATSAAFRRYFDDGVARPGRSHLGAWKDGRLAAFVSVVRVDDWAELGSFSMDSMLHYRPNDALMYTVLSRYLAERGCRVVTYGLSSIQVQSNARGLHRFKTKVGFDAIPVHRAFALHPSIRALSNRATLTAAHWMVTGLLSVRPRNRRLRKLGGMLAYMLGGRGVKHMNASKTRPPDPAAPVSAGTVPAR